MPAPEVTGGQRVKVLDFGVARLGGMNSDPGSVKPRTGALMGTPSRSDIYARG